MSLVYLEGVTLTQYEGRPAFDALTLELERGDHLLVEGADDSGKTALLKLISGAAEPETGQVVRQPNLVCAMVFAAGGLLANQSLLDNVALPLRFTRGFSYAHARDRAMGALVTCGLEDVAHMRPHALEPRERKLAQLARAEAIQPDLLALDEPLQDLSDDDHELVHFLLSVWATSPRRCVVVATARPQLMQSHDFRVLSLGGRVSRLEMPS